MNYTVTVVTKEGTDKKFKKILENYEGAKILFIKQD